MALPLGLTACTRGPAAPPVRPAAHANPTGAPQPMFFSPPFALATPEDAVVRVVGPERICTGTLIEDDLVLTAHHCLVKRGAHGEFTAARVDAAALQIELGGDYLAWGPCGATGGGGDLAIVVLERKLVGVTTMQARLDRAPRIGEPLDPIGFGRCALSDDGVHRELRPGGLVAATTQETFVMNASICPGDSGGPVIARGTHEVVGVISQSAMDGDERTRSATILARLDAYRAVFGAARQIADGANPAELPPLSCAP
jgi:hypothetical protein